MFRRRLPTTAIVLFGTAAVCIVAAIVLLRGYAARLESTRPDLGPPVAIVVAATDLMRGATLTESMLAERDIPASLEPPGAVPAIDPLIGRVLVSDLTAGEAVTESRLAGARAGPVAGLVPDGSVGMVVSSGLPAGTVVPGDRITLFATFGGRSPHTETVASGVDVVRILESGSEGAVPGMDGGGERTPRRDRGRDRGRADRVRGGIRDAFGCGGGAARGRPDERPYAATTTSP